MVRIVRPPELYIPEDPDAIKVFLAGGLQKCNWQDACLEYFTKRYTWEEDVIIYTPYREDFDVNDPNMEVEQITWEFNYLTNLAKDPKYIFSMYFDHSESQQPICFYELGRYLPMVHPYKCVITTHPFFSRRNDVVIQTALATDNRVMVASGSPEHHAELISHRIAELNMVNPVPIAFNNL